MLLCSRDLLYSIHAYRESNRKRYLCCLRNKLQSTAFTYFPKLNEVICVKITKVKRGSCWVYCCWVHCCWSSWYRASVVDWTMTVQFSFVPDSHKLITFWAMPFSCSRQLHITHSTDKVDVGSVFGCYANTNNVEPARARFAENPCDVAGWFSHDLEAQLWYWVSVEVPGESPWRLLARGILLKLFIKLITTIRLLMRVQRWFQTLCPVWHC